MAEILTVSSLNLYVKSILDSDDNLYDVAVEGELSNFKKISIGTLLFHVERREIRHKRCNVFVLCAKFVIYTGKWYEGDNSR